MKAVITYAELRERYVRIKAGAHAMRVAETGVLLLIVSYVILFFADMFIALQDNRPLLHIVRIATILACLEYLRIAKRYPKRAMVLAHLIHLSVVGVGAFLMHREITLGTTDGLAVPAGYILTFSFILTIGAPARGPWVLIAAVSYVAMMFAACMTPSGEYLQLALINTYVVVAAAILHVIADLLAEQMARTEIDMRLKLAPLDIVRGATVSGDDYMSFELPRQQRPCICLASDWRGYQALSRSTPPESLQVILGAYYEMCQSLLAKCWPNGEFFSDWIADELLIFFVADDPSRMPELARIATTFARALIDAKIDFAAQHRIPFGIDVGLAAGEAPIGLFGPRSNRKVMAVGQVAVDARRLQGVGKQLRHQLGEGDRIVYAESLRHLAGAAVAARPLGGPRALHVDAPPVQVLYEEPRRPAAAA